MELRKFKHYVRRSIQLGPREAASVVYSRLHARIFDMYWKSKALLGKSRFRWEDIVRKHSAKKYKKFSAFWVDASKRIVLYPEDFKFSYTQEMLSAQAETFVHNCFSILGSPLKNYEKIPWHCDIRLQEENGTADCNFDAQTYFKDITIKAGKDRIEKDIKVPWELSRLQHFLILGLAYQASYDEKYTQTFILHYQDWLTNNGYLLGVNWSCPMDVGIRAVNIIWALELFKESATLSQEFLQEVTESLYDHFYYLENNWEIYDSRTSNHYLSDLIGYFYLCYYFYDLPHVKQKAEWCFKELLAESKKQIFEEGADYEGSTSYHGLITEIFYHFYCLAPKMGFVFDQNFIEKISKMFSFIDWCTPSCNNSIIRIGDDDSGKILYFGLSKDVIQAMKSEDHEQVKHFKDFGLSVVKTDRVHYSLRHHVYKNNQPSGHFHNDVASITLALDGEPLFIDPGSYLYTPSAFWRNHFRSVKNHNSFYVKGSELVEFDDFLFSLQLPEHEFLSEWIDEQKPYCLKTSHTLYKKLYALTAYRSIEYKESVQQIIITDCWRSLQKKDPDLIGCWNFTLHPDITISRDSNEYIFSRNDKNIATFKSGIDFTVSDGFASFSYGTKMITKQLRAVVNLMHDDPIETMITLL